MSIPDIEQQIEYVKSHLTRPIVIIGMMGAGKTTLARKVSESLKWDFLDSDIEIEKEDGISIQDMFTTKGEAYFRGRERDKIAQMLDKGGHIISVGGGAITSPETAQNIFSKSLCLWIDAPVSVLAKRVSNQGTRPLLNGRDAEEVLTERMAQRKHLYQQAHIHVDGSSEISRVAKNAIGEIYEYLLQKSDGI